MDDVYSIKIYYLDNSFELITGIIDYEQRVIRIMQFENERFRVKGFITFNAIKRVDLLKRLEAS